MTHAPTELRRRGWQQEAALRMLENNLHPEVAERPEELVVYGGIGKAARDLSSLATIKRELMRLGDDETLLVVALCAGTRQPAGWPRTDPLRCESTARRRYAPRARAARPSAHGSVQEANDGVLVKLRDQPRPGRSVDGVVTRPASSTPGSGPEEAASRSTPAPLPRRRTCTTQLRLSRGRDLERRRAKCRSSGSGWTPRVRPG